MIKKQSLINIVLILFAYAVTYGQGKDTIFVRLKSGEIVSGYLSNTQENVVTFKTIAGGKDSLLLTDVYFITTKQVLDSLKRRDGLKQEYFTENPDTPPNLGKNLYGLVGYLPEPKRSLAFGAGVDFLFSNLFLVGAQFVLHADTRTAYSDGRKHNYKTTIMAGLQTGIRLPLHNFPVQVGASVGAISTREEYQSTRSTFWKIGDDNVTEVMRFYVSPFVEIKTPLEFINLSLGAKVIIAPRKKMFCLFMAFRI
ncbi:MAG: hypothetical protein HYV28_18145 [Ignavibacteriales bacterium]|nr:hypothetical protein [Ignavibacteriales bacterium]